MENEEKDNIIFELRQFYNVRIYFFNYNNIYFIYDLFYLNYKDKIKIL